MPLPAYLRYLNVVLVALALFVGSRGAFALPHGLDDVADLQEGRAKLWALREAGTIDQDQYRELGRKLEPRLRSNDLQRFMDAFKIKHGGRKPGQSGGILSDVDAIAPDAQTYEQFLRWVRKQDPDVEVIDRHSFRSEKLDIVGWRPPDPQPGARSAPAVMEQGMAQALNDEFALGAQAGGKPHPLESTLENITKAGKHLFEPLKPGHKAEDSVIQAGKDVLRSMQATGMCADNPAVCGWLNDLRSRARSPKDLGYDNPEQLRDRLKWLAGEALRSAEEQFAREHDTLLEQIERAATGPERDRLFRQADALAERALRMGARFETLHGRWPDQIRSVTRLKTPRQFWSEQNARIRALAAPRESANANVERAQKLSMTLNMLEFAKCLQEDTLGTNASRRAQAVRCIARAAADYVKGEIQERALDKAKVMIAVYVPGGHVIATTVIPAVMAGMAAYESGTQLGEAAWEYVQKNAAEKELSERERVLAAGQHGNTGPFARRLAAEEAAVAQALREMAAGKQALLEELIRLGQEQAELIERVKALQPRKARIEELLPALNNEIERCAARRGESAGASPASQIPDLLARAKRSVAECRGQRDVEAGDAAYRKAAEIVSSLSHDLERARTQEAARSGVEKAARGLQSALQGMLGGLTRAATGAAGRGSLVDEAQRAHHELEEAALAARSSVREIGRFRERVEALNRQIAEQARDMGVKLQGFTHATSPELVAAIEQHSPRLEGLRSDIAALTPLATGQWHPQWEVFFKRDAPLRAFAQYMGDSGKRSGQLLAQLRDCSHEEGGDRLASEFDRAVELMTGPGAEYRAQRQTCLARLQGADSAAAEARLKDLVAREEAALKSRVEALKSAKAESLTRYDSGLRTAEGLVGQREARAKPGAGAKASAGDLATAPELCVQAQAAQQKLAGTLHSIEADQAEIEAGLKQAQQLAGSCKDRAAAVSAQRKIEEAGALQTRVDQQAAALALLAVQVDGLAGKRTALLKRRNELQALTPTSAPAAPAGMPSEVNVLQRSLDELKGYDRRWAAAEAQKLQVRIDALRGQTEALPAAALEAALGRLAPYVQAAAALALTDEELSRRSQEVAALRQRAEAALRAAAPVGEADAKALRAALQAPACLDQAEPDIQAGMRAADTARSLAQLASDKLGAGAREKILACTEKLARGPTASDKQAQVAAKVCRYHGSEAVWGEQQGRPMCRCKDGSQWNKDQTACVSEKEARVAEKVCKYLGSEAVWDERQGRPMCRCRAGSTWNKDQTACIPEKEAQLAEADCARFPNTEPRWNEVKGKVVCGCRKGFVLGADRDGCEPDAKAAMAQLKCSGPREFPYWDVIQGEAQCRCEPGYERGPLGGDCVAGREEAVASKDCSRYPNSEAYWDEAKGRAMCTCRAGTRPAATRDGCVDVKAALASARCGDHADAFWDDEQAKPRCRCRDGVRVDPASGLCRPTPQARVAERRPPEPPTPAQRTRYAGWVGTWPCAFRASAMGESKIIQRMTLRFREQAGTLMMAIVEGDWGAPPMSDDRHIEMPGPPEWPVMRFELNGNRITSHMTMKYMGQTGNVVIDCRKQ